MSLHNADTLKKILVIQTAFIGDVILATSVLEKLHKYFPDAKLDFLVRAGNESLLMDHPFINNCLVWEKKKNKYSGLLNLLRTIRKSHYDHVINLQRFAASGFLTAFSGAKEKIGFDKNPFSFLFTRKITHVIGDTTHAYLHEVARSLKTIEHLTEQEFVRPRLYPSKSDFEKVQQYIAVPFITISPASVWFTKQVPASIWKQLIAQIPNRRVYLLGAPGERELCEEIQTAGENVQTLAGELSLLQSAALMKSAEMNYTGDSAPMHLCSAMNAPVTAVFCSTIPEYGFGPLSDRSFVVQTHELLDCRPCGLHGFQACPKGHFNCSKITITDLTLPIVSS